MLKLMLLHLLFLTLKLLKLNVKMHKLLLTKIMLGQTTTLLKSKEFSVNLHFREVKKNRHSIIWSKYNLTLLLQLYKNFTLLLMVLLKKLFLLFKLHLILTKYLSTCPRLEEFPNSDLFLLSLSNKKKVKK